MRMLRSKQSLTLVVMIIAILVVGNNVFVFLKVSNMKSLSTMMKYYDPSRPSFSSSKEEYEFQFQYNKDEIPRKKTDSTTLSLVPDWLEEMLESQPSSTHHESLADPNQKFLVLTCHKYNGNVKEECGGLVDRLALIPYYLLLAYETKRMLLIKYSTPYPLEEFLIPVNFDWTLPTHYVKQEWDIYANRTQQQYKNQRRIQWHKHIHLNSSANQRFILVNTNLIKRHVTSYFQQQTGISTDDIWPTLFRRLFQPSKPIAQTIDRLAARYKLIPGHYGGVHTRLNYPTKNLVKNEQNGFPWQTHAQQAHGIGINAINCILQAQPNTTHIYLASDSHELIHDLLLMYQNNFTTTDKETTNNITLITREGVQNKSLHFNSKNFGQRKEDYYATIIDLWMLAHTNCISQGLGGFAHFTSILSGYHHKCRVRHRDYDSQNPLYNCPTPQENKIRKQQLNIQSRTW